MRVLIDAREFVPGRLTGIGRLLINMLAPLVDLDDGPEIILAGTADCIPAELAGFKCVPLPYKQTQLMDQIGLPKLAKQHGCDLIYIPYYKAPFICKTPVVISVHDICFLRHQTGLRGLKRWLVAAQLRASCKKATRIMTISEFSKLDLGELLPVSAKTDVIHLDYPTEWVERIQQVNPDKAPEPYYLYVGTFKRYKNVDELVRAWALLKQRKALDGQKLVLVGGRGDDLARIENLIAELDVSDCVQLPGFVSDDELFELYRNANWFITASGYEGFGLPPLEAMACGCPVIYHHATSMMEVLGDAAWPLRSPDAAVVAGEVKKTIELGKAERRAFIEKGRERIEQFAPGNSARKFLALLSRV